MEEPDVFTGTKRVACDIIDAIHGTTDASRDINDDARDIKQSKISLELSLQKIRSFTHIIFIYNFITLYNC